MRKFLFVLLIVLLGVGVLAACAPIENIGTEAGDYVKTLPAWAIVVGAIVLFFIGFGIIWRLIPGFIKVIALIVLAVVIVGISIGVWKIFGIDNNTINDIGDAIKSFIP